jgi:hypothetical protein
VLPAVQNGLDVWLPWSSLRLVSLLSWPLRGPTLDHEAVFYSPVVGFDFRV